MADLCWYACVYEGEKTIVYGRAPCGEEAEIVEEIKRSLNFHRLIGLNSKIFLRSDRFLEDDVIEFCERRMEKNKGHYGGYRITKLDLRW